MTHSTEEARVVIHRGPIPGTAIGHHWFVAADGERYGIEGDPRQGGGEFWSYVIVDRDGQEIDDSCSSYREIREYASTFRPAAPNEEDRA